ncbi:MAG: Uma2 family endonuclease [Planctomycetes bacterium]|nr:Uma2 family endonuclease [Planctomycetota bacterium]
MLPREHVLLEGISWETYARMRRELDPRPIRLTYDDKRLEIVLPGRTHHRDRKRLGRLVDTLTELRGLPLESGGSTTWQREDLRKGLEPDECYWLQHAADVRGRDELDLRFDPPPNLAIEVDVSTSSLDRMAIYGALGVPEVWRWKDDCLTAYRLDGPGSRTPRGYVEASTSLAIKGLVVADLAAWVIRARSEDETTWIRAFRTWVRNRWGA